MKKRFLSLLLAGIMALAVGCPTAFAASKKNAKTWYSPVFYIQDTRVCAADVGKGDGMPFILYDGSIYVPLKTLSYWSGREVTWDDLSRTISIKANGTSPVVNTCPDAPRDIRNIKIEILPAVAAQVDSVPKSLSDGKKIIPIRYQETIYLPLRAYSELIDWEILYEKSTSQEHVYFHEKISDEQKEALKTYIQTASGINDRLKVHVEACFAETDTQKTIRLANEILKDVDELAALSRPEIAALKAQYATLDEGIAVVRENHESLISQLSAGVDLVTAKRSNYLLFYATKPIRGDVKIDAMIQTIPRTYFLDERTILN